MGNIKKTEEYNHLKNFLKLLCQPYDSIEETECPDFIVTLDGRQAGIEVTRFHPDSPQKEKYPLAQIEGEISRLKENVEKEAEKYPELKGHLLQISPKIPKLPPKSQYKIVIDEVIQIARYLTQEGYDEIEPDERFPHSKECAKRVRLEKLDPSSPFEFLWSNPSFCELGKGKSIEDGLLKVVKRKFRKASNYRKVDELWLLIVDFILGKSQMGTPESLSEKLNRFKRLNDFILKTKRIFSKIYIYQPFFLTIYENDERGRWIVKKSEWEKWKDSQKESQKQVMELFRSLKV